jgi:hypothetical protein
LSNQAPARPCAVAAVQTDMAKDGLPAQEERANFRFEGQHSCSPPINI